MDGKKVYQIQINGISESVSAIESLNKQLDDLEKRIKELGSKNIKIDGGSVDNSAIKEQVAKQKELNQLKKEEAAQQRLIADEYENTMKGMKQNLADLKTVINATDLGDSDSINKMTKDANELTNKLKAMEQAYGQFGRNVGNYANGIAEGLQKVKINVGGTVREFDNARQASRTLNNELKAMAVNGQQDTKEFKELRQALLEMESTMNDAKKPMDNLMDTMESFVAIASVYKGIGAFFGVDDSKIQKTIQQLLALQTALKGIQTIQKQMQTREGIGKWIVSASSAMDAFAAKITKTDKAAKALSLTLKGISLLAIVAVIYQLIKGLSDLKKKEDDVTKATEEGVNAYAKAEVELAALKTKLDNFNGSKNQEKKLVNELNSKYGTSLGQYKSLKEWKDALIKKGTVYCQVLQKEAETQALMNLYTENYIKLLKARQAQEAGNQDTVDLILKALQGQASLKQVWASIKDDIKAPFTDNLNEYNEELEREVNMLEQKGNEIMDMVKKNQSEISKLNEENKINDYAPQIEKNTAKTKNALEDGQRTLNQLELRLMQDGLNKKLRQLDEEERQTINKLKENGRKSAIEIQKIQRAYAAMRVREIKEYLKKLEDSISESAKNIENIKIDIDITHIKNTINSLKNLKEEMETLGAVEGTFQPFTSSSDLKKNGINADNQLSESFKNRYQITEEFYASLIKSLIQYQKDEQALIKENVKEEEKQQREAEGERYSIQMSGLTATKKLVEDGLKAIVDKYGEATEEGAIIIKTSNEEILTSYRDLQAQSQEIDDQIEKAKKQHKDKLQEITKAANNEIKKNELDTAKDISTTQEKYYNLQITNFREFLSKLNNEVNKNPVVDKNWGIVNVKQTKKNYNEIIAAAKLAIKNIEVETKKVSNDPLLTDQAKAATKKQLEDIKNSIEEGLAVTEEASANLIADFIASTQMYLQAALQVLNSALDAMWDVFDRAFDEEQKQLDRENEAFQEALDKQRDMIRDHSNEINSIEDELSTARGSRRQHLIDQLNAEMELQREAAKEKQRLDREEQKNKEQMQKKQDALDKKRRKAEYANNIAQAIINGAMAVTYAAMNKWPIPAIPMMKLAGATAAAQLAIVLANRPYAKGGLLEGPSHREGGIPVGNTGIEVEGHEYVIRKRSTTQNIDLLDYINKSERKLDLSDFIDFYSSKVKKTVTSSSPRNKFADGGVVPTLNSEYQFDDRLLSAFEDYANRPYIVSVVDINSRQAAVKNVQVLAGLGE